MRFFYISLFFCLWSLQVFSQDVHLTQYYTSHLSLNPAYTGNYDGDLRATLNSRTQWAELSKSIKTNMFSVEKKILNHNNEIGLGMIFINDFLSAYYLQTNKVLVSASYQKKIHKHIFRVGIQGGPVFRSLNMGNQTLPDQWNYNAGIFDMSIPTGESVNQNSWTYADINAGISWARMYKDLKLSAGYGLFHLNHPKELLSIHKDGMPYRHVLNTSATYYASSIWWFTPSVLYMNSSKATDIIFITNAHRAIKKNISVMLGGGYRGSTVNSDAVMLITGLNFNRLMFGISRDFTISSLPKNTAFKSAWEISLIYTTPGRIHDKMTIPCDRY
jgi:type IX secretion system PorP/SprF family membrane protein